MKVKPRLWSTLSATAAMNFGVALGLALVPNARADSSDIQYYYVAKEHRFAQTSVAPSIEAANPWQFNAEIVPTSGTSAGTSSVQSPVLTLPDTSNTPFSYNTSKNTWRIRVGFPDRPSFESSYPNGSYTFSMPTVSPPATTFNAILDATGDAYPTSAPTLSNNSWSGGSLVIDPTQDFTLRWNPFTGALPGAFILVSIHGISDQQLAAGATSFTLPANSLPPGQVISAAQVNFVNPTSTNTTSVPGVTGQGGYFTSVVFDIQTLGPAQDVQNYSVGKTASFVQTSASAPTLASFGFTAIVNREGGGSLSSASITLPAGSTNQSPQALGPDGNGNLVFNDGSITQAGLDAKFNNGIYGFDITGGAGSYSASLTLTGNSYPAPPPTITNPTWSGGALVVDPAQNFTFTWNSFANFTPGDQVGLFDETGSFNFNFDTNTTSQFIPAGTLAPNTTYTFHLTFYHSVDTNTSSIPGATGEAGFQDNTNFTVQTAPGPPVIISPLVATGTVGLPFTYQFEASGATSLGVSNLAPGLTFNTNLRAVTGIPTTAGTFQVGLSATNPQGTTNATLTITVQPAPPAGPVIVSSSCATGRTGRPFSFQLQAKGGSSATRFATDGLPPGFSLDPVTGFISGIPNTNGSFSVAVSAIDGASTTQATLQLTFTSAPTVPIITSAATAILTPGQPFTYTMTADANGVFGYIGTDGIVHQAPSPSCAGLPAGLCFDGDHTISGIYNPPFGHGGGLERIPNLSGGIVTNVQLFATDPSGTGTFPLIGFIATPGTVQISTRLTVGTGDNVLIGGFIIVGNGTTRVLVRAIGPSLAPGVPNVLADPILELREGGTLLASNDNWEDTQGFPIRDTQIPPTNNLESAILAFLSPGAYTATVRGKNSTTGNALVEVYDLGIAAFEPRGDARLANISTRGTVLTGDNVIIGGFFVRPEAPATSTRVVVRAIGPSLPVPGALGDPTLELHDSDGGLIDANDNWRSDHEAELIATTIPPSNDLESAIVRNLTPGPYTAIVQGSGGLTGVALVEVYALQ